MLACQINEFRTSKLPRAQKVVPVRAAQICAAILLAFAVLRACSMFAAARSSHAFPPDLPKLSVYGETPLKASSTAIAARFVGVTDSSGFPPPDAWQNAQPVSFHSNWQGENSDPDRATEVRLLWTDETLYLKFVAHYRVISVFNDSEPNGRRDKLWDRDVAEVFLQPDPSELRRYKEFEVSPNGLWIDLDINNGGLADLKSGMQRRVSTDEAAKIWTAELAIPMKSLVQHFDPHAIWRVNFYRVEGPAEPRFYSSWQPTKTPQPNFHVPELFGYLKFVAR
jgi:alpha-galactosidase